MRRHVIVIAVAVAVVLAGCSFPGSTDRANPDESVTAAPVPDVAIGAPEVSPLSIPGITNASRISPATLARAHRKALETQPVRIRAAQNSTLTGIEVRDRTGHRNATLVVGGPGSYRYDETRVYRYFDAENRTVTTVGAFANESVGILRSVRDSTTRYRSLAPGQRPSSLLWNTSTLVRQYLSVRRATVDRITWHGRTVYRVVGYGAAGGVYSLTSEYEVRAIVQPDGLVRRLSVDYVESPMGHVRDVQYTLSIDPIDSEKVTPPAWLPTGLNRTTPSAPS